MRNLVVAVCAAACLTLLFQSAAAAAPPTIEDARADFAAGDYPGSLRKASALLSSRTLKADSQERYDLLMLRGEALMRLKQRTQAATAFEAAAKVMKSRKDLPQAVAATALAVLTNASPEFTYRPTQRSGGAGTVAGTSSGISILEPDSRREAMRALFADLNARITPRVDKALRDTSLVSIQAILRDLWELYSVEYAANGEARSTEGRLEELGGHARALIGEELERLTTWIQQLNDLSGEPTWVTNVISYRGLTTNERNELKQAADYLVQIQRTAENARRIARLLGRTGENWDSLLADCAVARDVAQQAYDRRY